MRLSLSRKFNKKKTIQSRLAAPWERLEGRAALRIHIAQAHLAFPTKFTSSIKQRAAHPISRRNAWRLDDRASNDDAAAAAPMLSHSLYASPSPKSFSPALMVNEYLFPRAKKRRPVTLFTGSFRVREKVHSLYLAW